MRYANFHVTWVPAMLSPCRAPRGAAKRLCCAGDHRGEEDRAPTQGGGCSTGEATVEKRIGGGRGGGQRNRRGRSLAALSRARQHAALVSAARGGGDLGRRRAGEAGATLCRAVAREAAGDPCLHRGRRISADGVQARPQLHCVMPSLAGGARLQPWASRRTSSPPRAGGSQLAVTRRAGEAAGLQHRAS
jgi:hypothetical protein